MTRIRNGSSFLLTICFLLGMRFRQFVLRPLSNSIGVANRWRRHRAYSRYSRIRSRERSSRRYLSRYWRWTFFEILELRLPFSATQIEIVGDDLVLNELVDDVTQELSVTSDGTRVTFSDPRNTFRVSGIAGASGDGTSLVDIPLSSFQGKIIVNAKSGGDAITVDIGNDTTPFDRTIETHGGLEASNRAQLFLVGSKEIDHVSHSFLSDDSGTIFLMHGGSESQVSYTGLGQITDTLFAVERQFTFLDSIATGETITIDNRTGLQNRIGSTAGVDVSFSNPRDVLHVETSSASPGGEDRIEIEGLHASFAADLIITGDEDDAVRFQLIPTVINGEGRLGVSAGLIVQESGPNAAPLKVAGKTMLNAFATGRIDLGQVENEFHDAVTVTQALSATIVNQNDFKISSIVALDEVHVQSIEGAIVEETPADTGEKITTRDLALRAKTGIGGADDQNGIDIAVEKLAATTASGPILINDNGSLEIGNVGELAGVTITDNGSSGDIRITDGKPSGNELLNVNQIVSNAGSGNIVIFADGTSASGDELNIGADVIASGGNISLVAFGNIDFGGSPSIATQGSGSIVVHAGTTLDGDNPIHNGSPAAKVLGGNDYELATPAGDISITAPDDIELEFVNANSDGTGEAGTVLIESDSDGDHDGAIIDRVAGETILITADRFVATAAEGIGSGDPIETAVRILAATNTESGNIEFVNRSTSPLTVGEELNTFGLRNDWGEIRVSSTTSLTIAADIIAGEAIVLSAIDAATTDSNHLVLNESVAVESMTDVQLRGGDNILLPVGSSVVAENQLSIEGDYGNLDDQSGTLIRLNGNLQSHLPIEVTSGPDNDRIEVASAESGAFKIDGNSGNDIYVIELASLANDVTLIERDTVGRDQLFVEASDLSDSVQLNLNGRAEVTDGGATISFSDALELIELNTLGGNDTVTVQPSTNTEFHLFGGDHSTAGDTLRYLTPLGEGIGVNTVPPDMNTIETTGSFLDIQYQQFEIADFDTEIQRPVFDFSAEEYYVSEGDSARDSNVVRVFRSGNTEIAASVDVLLVGDSATQGIDFTAATIRLAFGRGETSKDVPVEILGDDRLEPTESVEISFTAFTSFGKAGTSQPTALLFIRDDDLPAITINERSIPEGDVNVVHHVDAHLSKPVAHDVRVDFRIQPIGPLDMESASSHDFRVEANSFTFPAGETTASIPIEIIGDNEIEGLEAFTILIYFLFSPGEQVAVRNASSRIVIVDDDQLVVEDVKVGSTVWADSFRQYVDPIDAFGYSIPNGSNQLAPLPWANIDQIQLRFSHDIESTFSSSLFALGGFNIPDYQIVNAHYDPADFAATITLESFLGDDQVVVVASDRLQDSASDARLDGEWSTGQRSRESGNGIAGGNFSFQFRVLPGDVDQSGTIRVNDSLTTFQRLFKDIGNPDYLPFADINGDGQLRSNDGIFTLQRQFTEISTGAPVVPVVPRPIALNCVAAARAGIETETDDAHRPNADLRSTNPLDLQCEA